MNSMQLPHWSVIALALWAAGVMGVLVHGLARYSRFVRRLRDVRPPIPEWNNEWRSILRESGVSTAVELRVATDIGPVLCRSPRNSLVVVPESLWSELTSAERTAVLRHEVEHVRRRDLWWSICARLLAAIHWFNPFAWWAVANFDVQGEFACDLAAGREHRLQLADLLLRMGTGTRLQAAGVKAVGGGGLYERIERLITGSVSTSRWRSALPLIVAATIAGFAAVRFEVTALAVADDEAAIEANTDTPWLPEQAAVRLGIAPFATRDSPSDIAFSPDSQRVAAAEANSASHIVRVFDVATGREVIKLADAESGNGWFNCLAFSPDGNKLAGGDSKGRLIVWDVAQQQVLFREPLLDDRVGEVAFSPDGQLIAISGSRGGLQLRSAMNPSEIVRELQVGSAKALESGGFVESGFDGSGRIAFTADGGKLISANSTTGTVLVWNVATGTLLYTLNAIEGSTSDFGGPALISVSVTPDGESIFTSGHRTVPRDTTTLGYGPKNVWIPQNRIWDLETGRMQRDLSDQHEYGLGSSVLFPEGDRLLTQLYDEIVIRDLDDLRVRHRFPLNGEFGDNLTLSPDGKSFALRLDGRLAVFDVETAQRLHWGELAGMDHVMSADWSRDGDRIATAGTDGKVRLWNASTGELVWSRPLAPYISPTGDVSRPSFVALDGSWQRVIAAGDRDDYKLWRCGTVTVFNVATGQVRGDLLLRNPIRKGAVAPNNRVAVFAGSHGSIGDTKLYGVNLDTLTVKFEAPSDDPRRGLWDVQAIEFLPDSSAFRVATGDSQIIEFDADSGEQVRAVSIDWRNEEQRAANKPRTPQLWEGSFTPGAALLVSVSAENVYLWDAGTGEQKLQFRHPHDNGCRLAIAPDGETIATADMQYAGDYGTDTIRFYNASGKELKTFDPGDARANVLVFSPDGSKLFTGFYSQPPVIWGLQ